MQHRFLRELADGSLLQAAFQHYLQQDYRFLIHFARDYAKAILDLHVALAPCVTGYTESADWINAHMQGLPETRITQLAQILCDASLPETDCWVINLEESVRS